MKLEKQHTHTTKGFTIIELLVVVVVIAILVSVVIVAYNGIQGSARRDLALTDANGLAKQLASIYTTSGAYPADLSSVKVSSSSSVLYLPSADSLAFCATVTNSVYSYTVSSLNLSATAGSCDVTNGLAGRWKLNGNADDSSGNGKNGVVGGTSVAGMNGSANGAYAFSGGSAVITLPATSLTNTPFTISAWVRVDAFNSGQAAVAGTSSGGWTADHNLHLGYRNNRPYFALYGDDYNSPTTVITGTWHFLAFVLKATGEKQIYLDGNLDGTTTGYLYTGTFDQIGYNCCMTGSINGTIDDTRLYTRALSAAEILSLYLLGAQ